MNKPARSLLWIRWLLKQTGIESLITACSSALFIDSTAAEHIANNPLQSERTKHIAIKYHFVRELIEVGVLHTEHVESSLNVSDICTKDLGKRKFEPLSDQAMGRVGVVQPTKRKKTIISDEFV